MSDGLLIKGILNSDPSASPVNPGVPFKFEIDQADAWDLLSSFVWITNSLTRIQWIGKPQYVAAGGTGNAIDAEGGVFTVDASNGIWRNGRKQGVIVNNVFVQAKGEVLLVHGDEIFARAATSGEWWQWLGTKWLTKPDNSNGLDQTLLDPAIFIPKGTAIPT